MTYRIFCVNGPGDTIKDWLEDDHDPRSITFKSQFKQFCRDVGAETYVMAYHDRKAIYREGPVTLEHRPKPMPGASGTGYHIAQAYYALSLLFTAVRFRADAAVLDSGTSHFFMLGLFKLVGIKIVIILHNTLWPTGFPPSRRVPQFIAKLDSLFFRYLPTGTIGVSPECIRQVQQLTKGKHRPLCQIRAQFRREYFAAIPAPPAADQRPFRILYMGRITRDKGVFDILQMAKRIEAEMNGRVKWEIHGVGSDLEELKRLHGEMSLTENVLICGWTSPQVAQEVYARSHLSIAPTRSNFSEGMCMAAVESVLAGRPVITSPVVPALEVLRPACVEARTDDVGSYVHAILELIDDQNKYKTLCDACPKLQEQFYDPAQGLRTALKKVLFPKLSKITTYSPDCS